MQININVSLYVWQTTICDDTSLITNKHLKLSSMNALHELHQPIHIDSTNDLRSATVSEVLSLPTVEDQDIRAPDVPLVSS